VAHTSTAQAVAAVRQARRNGLRVTCEVAPHHFLLTEEHVGMYDTNAKMNPPLRSEADRDAMIQGILDGVVDAIATDHAPHARLRRKWSLSARRTALPAWNGAGAEPALAAPRVEDAAGAGAEPAERAAGCAAGPARARDATVGSFADVVIFDPKAEWVFRAKDSRSKSKNTPFDGWTMQGRVRWTISEGRVVFRSMAGPGFRMLT
jgi:dihydroorotase